MPVLIPFPVAFMAPRIHHKKNEYDEAENQKHDRPRLALPKLLDAARKIRMHVPEEFTSTRVKTK
jgi:hypothetical protein